MPDKVLVDTSVWIDFFRKRDHTHHDQIASLLRNARAVGTGIVALELLRGAKSDKEMRLVKELFEEMQAVDPTPATYFRAGELGHRLARKGCAMGTVDLLIAQLAMENDVSLFSLDQHFKTIAEHASLRLFE